MTLPARPNSYGNRFVGQEQQGNSNYRSLVEVQRDNNNAGSGDSEKNSKQLLSDVRSAVLNHLGVDDVFEAGQYRGKSPAQLHVHHHHHVYPQPSSPAVYARDPSAERSTSNSYEEQAKNRVDFLWGERQPNHNITGLTTARSRPEEQNTSSSFRQRLEIPEKGLNPHDFKMERKRSSRSHSRGKLRSLEEAAQQKIKRLSDLGTIVTMAEAGVGRHSKRKRKEVGIQTADFSKFAYGGRPKEEAFREASEAAQAGFRDAIKAAKVRLRELVHECAKANSQGFDAENIIRKQKELQTLEKLEYYFNNQDDASTGFSTGMRTPSGPRTEASSPYIVSSIPSLEYYDEIVSVPEQDLKPVDLSRELVKDLEQPPQPEQPEQPLFKESEEPEQQEQPEAPNVEQPELPELPEQPERPAALNLDELLMIPARRDDDDRFELNYEAWNFDLAGISSSMEYMKVFRGHRFFSPGSRLPFHSPRQTDAGSPVTPFTRASPRETDARRRVNEFISLNEEFIKALSELEVERVEEALKKLDGKLINLEKARQLFVVAVAKLEKALRKQKEKSDRLKATGSSPFRGVPFGMKDAGSQVKLRVNLKEAGAQVKFEEPRVKSREAEAQVKIEEIKPQVKLKEAGAQAQVEYEEASAQAQVEFEEAEAQVDLKEAAEAHVRFEEEKTRKQKLMEMLAEVIIRSEELSYFLEETKRRFTTEDRKNVLLKQCIGDPKLYERENAILDSALELYSELLENLSGLNFALSSYGTNARNLMPFVEEHITITRRLRRAVSIPQVEALRAPSIDSTEALARELEEDSIDLSASRELEEQEESREQGGDVVLRLDREAQQARDMDDIMQSFRLLKAKFTEIQSDIRREPRLELCPCVEPGTSSQNQELQQRGSGSPKSAGSDLSDQVENLTQRKQELEAKLRVIEREIYFSHGEVRDLKSQNELIINLIDEEENK